LVRQAVKSDVENMISILENSFNPNDGQRVLGRRLTVSLFRIFFKLPESIFLLAEEGQKPLGYVWIQLRPLSVSRCIYFAPIEILLFSVSVLRELKLSTISKLLKKQDGSAAYKGKFPKLMSLAVDQASRRYGIGTTLLTMVQEYLLKENKTEYFTITALDNLQAKLFYEKNGFKMFENNLISVLYRKTINTEDKETDE
jgi:ribosomal protein S18 acetylase RimI-like enzyme